MMKFIRRKSLLDYLEDNKDRIVKIAGYSLLPNSSEVQVKNVLDSSKYKEPNGNSCIGYWEKITGFEIKEDAVYYCPACGKQMSKRKDNLDGAHVYKPSNPDKWYFTPLCSECNNSENEKLMTVTTPLVPVPPECYIEKREK